ncbi:MAG: ATP-binding protein [bacterium]
MSFTLQPATEEDFVDREDILEEMLQTLTDEKVRMGYALVGPRRIGKTSILKEVARRLNQRDDIVAVYFSLWDIIENTAVDLCNQITISIIEAVKKRLSLKYKIAHILKVPATKFFDFLKTIDVKISIFEDIEISLAAGKKGEMDINLLVKKVFEFAERLAEELNLRLVLILDEFPSIMDVKNGTKLGEGIIKKIRTIQEDLTRTILCVSGSIRRTMDVAVLSPSAAFYRQFVIRHIGPFDISVVRALMIRNIQGEIKEEALEELYKLTKGIPFYVQFIGRELNRTGEKIINQELVQKAFGDFLAQEGDILFFEEFKSFSDKEKGIICAMAVHNLHTPKEICQTTKSNSNLISRYIEYFIDKGILLKQDKGLYEFTDPIFKLWLKKRYSPTIL